MSPRRVVTTLTAATCITLACLGGAPTAADATTGRLPGPVPPGYHSPTDVPGWWCRTFPYWCPRDR